MNNLIAINRKYYLNRVHLNTAHNVFESVYNIPPNQLLRNIYLYI